MSKEPRQHEDVLTRTGVLRAEFGRSYQFWLWLRKQFSLSSLGVIGAVIVAAGAYIQHLNGKVSEQMTHITVLETKVIPMTENSSKLDSMRVDIAVLAVTVSSYGSRIDRLELDVDRAHAVAEHDHYQPFSQRGEK